MSNQAQIDAQYEMEALSVEMGLQRYRETLANEGTAATSAGQELLKAAMGPMIQALKEWLEENRLGLASRSAGVFYFVDQFRPEVAAFLTAQAVLSAVDTIPTLTSRAERLAITLEGELTLGMIEKDQPALGEKMARKLKTIRGETEKAVFIRKGGILADVKVVAWDKAVRIRIGTLLLALFETSTGLIAIETVTFRGKSLTQVRATESCRKWLEESHARCELLQPVAMPMLCRPRDWSGPFGGGYLTPKLRRPLVKTRNRGYLQTLKESWDMPLVYAAVNALQRTQWSVNKDVYEVAKGLWESSSTLGGLPSRDECALPSRLWDQAKEPEPEVLSAWKVAAAQAYEANGRLSSKRVQVVQKLYVAELLLEKGNRFHYVYNLDWRGRMYPAGPALTPQGDDLAKGLLTFSHGCPLGDDGAYWLAIHGANTFGVDKVSFEERIEWVQANERMILDCAHDPLVFREWADADSPFCFLAFCKEWSRLSAFEGAQEHFVSYLPVAFDGSCNGLQNFSAMLRDPVGGAATGLVPSAKPADIYSAVARVGQRLIDAKAGEGDEVAQRWVGKLTRSLAKRNTMTVPYGVTLRGMQGQLFDQLKKDGGYADPREDARFLAQVNHDAIGQVVVAARLAMDWLKAAAKVAASNGLPVRWKSPVGFLALQDYRDDEGQKIDFMVLGRRLQLLLVKDGDKLNTRKQSLGIAPNFVHSLDAAHLMRTVLLCHQDGMKDFAMIHDSYGCHAGKAPLLRDNLRTAFVDQYREPVLEQFRDELLEQLPEELRAELPPLPPMGTLDLEQVRQSEYFFA